MVDRVGHPFAERSENRQVHFPFPQEYEGKANSAAKKAFSTERFS
jgi:hypothetical protein